MFKKSRIVKSLQNYWIFNSWVNFTATVTSTGFVYLMISQYRKKKYFNNIFIQDAIEKFGSNQKIIEECGTPIFPKIGFSARSYKSDKMFGFEFHIRGPRGKMNASVIGSGKKLSEMSEEDLKVYTIPSDETFQKALNLSQKEDSKSVLNESLSPDEVFWKFDYIAAERFPDNMKTVVYSDQKKIEDLKETPINVEKKDLVMSKPLKYVIELRAKKVQKSKAETEYDLEQLRKSRIDQMYRNMAEIRLYLLIGAGVSVICGYIFVKKYQRKAISSGELQMRVENIVRLHPKVKENIGFQRLRIHKTIYGANIDGKSKYAFDISGENGMGKVYVEGIYDKKKLVWDIRKLGIVMKNSEEEIPLK